jgi:aryl-alcohol dehydrogenase
MTASFPAKAAVLRSSDAPFRIEDVQIELPRADELLVRLVATGICHSDMVMRDQGLPTPQPVVLGHEGAGIVEQVGAAITHVRPGDHVVLAFNSCGHCPSCNDHAPSYCFEFFPRNFMGTRPDGSSPLTSDTGMIYANIFGQSSFATRAIARGRNAVKVAKDAPLELLGPLGCGVMTGAGAVMNESRLSLARELGATETLVGSTIGLAAAVTDAAAGTLNYAIDTTGRPDVIRVAADALGPRGVLGLVGANAPGDEISFDAVSIMSGGRMVRGVVEGDADPHTFIPKLIALHAKGLFPFDRLIKFYPFEDINTAFRDGEDGRTVKPVLKIGSPI